MLGGSSGSRLSRRRAVQVFIALAGAAVVPLGSVVHAQSDDGDAPSTDAQPTGTTPAAGTNPPTTAGNANTGTPTRGNNRFTPPPPASGTQQTAGNPVITSPLPDTASNQTGAGQTAPGQSTASQPASAPSAADRWVQNVRDTDLWSGPDDKAVSFGSMPAFSYFKIMAPQDGSRIKVQNPLGGIAYVAAKDLGPSGPPPEWYLAQKNLLDVPARIIGGANVRRTPGIADDNIVDQLGHNASIDLLGQVKGTDGDTWYRIGQNEFVHESLVRRPSQFQPHPGKIIVAELNEPCIVTAYEDGKAVYATLSLKGTTTWGTPTGAFSILRRVQNETMSSETLGIPRNGPGGYYLENVLYTQYFTNDGASIHYNYWSSNWGYSGSHGCLGMSYDDALWYWNWADVGTPLFIQE
jgi:hypothetical protein